MSRTVICQNVVLGLMLVLLPWPAVSQGRKRGGTGSTARSNPSPPPVVPGPSRQGSPRQPQGPSFVVVFGEVVQEDGSPLPSGVVIERTCNNHTTKEAYVDSAGHFQFQVGGPNRVSDLMPDASDDNFGGPVPGRTRRTDQPSLVPGSTQSLGLMGCELRARLAGYQSSRLDLNGNSSLGPVNAGTIWLVPLSKVQGTLVSATDMAAPKPARKAFEGAQNAFKKNKLDDVEKNLNKAIELYPNYAAAWSGLGQLYQVTKRNEDARRAYSSAIAADSRYVGPYIQLAHLAGLEHKWQEVADLTDRALALDPVDFPEGYFYNSIAHYQLKNLDAAERSARKAQRLDSLHLLPQVHLVLANILQQKHDIAGTIEQLHMFVNFAPPSDSVQEARSRLQKLEMFSQDLANKQPEQK